MKNFLKVYDDSDQLEYKLEFDPEVDDEWYIPLGFNGQAILNSDENLAKLLAMKNFR